MIPLSLASIAEITGARLGAGTDPGAVADSVVIDSRKAGPGSLVAALPGELADGHDFAAAAIGLAVAIADKGDVIVVAGKGHERGQYIGQQVIPFDDREVAAGAIARLRRGGPGEVIL